MLMIIFLISKFGKSIKHFADRWWDDNIRMWFAKSMMRWQWKIQN